METPGNDLFSSVYQRIKFENILDSLAIFATTRDAIPSPPRLQPRAGAQLTRHKKAPDIIRQHRHGAALADWWIAQERLVADRVGPDGRACESLRRFRFGETYAELKATALARDDLFSGQDGGALDDDPAAHARERGSIAA